MAGFGRSMYGSWFPHLETTGEVTGESFGPGESTSLKQAAPRQKKRNKRPNRADLTRLRRINWQRGSLVIRPTFSPIFICPICASARSCFLVGLMTLDESLMGNRINSTTEYQEIALTVSRKLQSTD